ncbi:hypothetical protein CCP3SC15_530010 [Gammaproteobacteria bacterium]
MASDCATSNKQDACSKASTIETPNWTENKESRFELQEKNGLLEVTGKFEAAEDAGVAAPELRVLSWDIVLVPSKELSVPAANEGVWHALLSTAPGMAVEFALPVPCRECDWALSRFPCRGTSDGSNLALPALPMSTAD